MEIAGGKGSPGNRIFISKKKTRKRAYDIYREVMGQVTGKDTPPEYDQSPPVLSRKHPSPEGTWRLKKTRISKGVGRCWTRRGDLRG